MKNTHVKYIYVLLFLGLAPFFGNSQDLTGIWRGHFRSNGVYQRYTDEDDRYKMEVQIAQTQKAFQAITYSYKSQQFYGKADATGTVDNRSQRVLLRELKITEVRMMSGDACTMTCFMQYSKLGDEEFLEGTYTSTNTRDSSGCGKGSIFLHKVISSDFHKEPFLEKKEKELELKKKNPVAKLATKSNAPKKIIAAAVKQPAASVKKKESVVPKELPVQQAPVAFVPEQHIDSDGALKAERHMAPVFIPKDLATRSNDLARSLVVTSEDVAMSIYDDGAVDNDTVSVYYDNKLILSHARLSEQPINVKLHVEPSDNAHELVMVAENLGDIPPNTSLLIVKDGDKRYEVRISTTEQKNAVVRFKYRKIE